MAAKSQNPDIAVLQAGYKSMENEISKLSTKLDDFIKEQRKRDEATTMLANTVQSRLEEKFVLLSDFAPIKRVVYGMIALILTAFMGALTALVFVPH